MRSLQIAAQDACDAEATRALPVAVRRPRHAALDHRLLGALERAGAHQRDLLAGSSQRRLAAQRLRPAAAAIREKTGLVLSPHYGASKLRWCLDHVPAVQRAARANDLAAGPLSSFLLSRLLDEKPVLADPANASRTLLFDPETLDWSQPLLDVFGVARGCLPALRADTARRSGTCLSGRRRIALAACTGDQSAAAFAFGPPRESLALVNVGTGAFVQRVAPAGVRLPDGLLRSVLRSDAEWRDARATKARSTAPAARSTGCASASRIDVERALAGPGARPARTAAAVHERRRRPRRTVLEAGLSESSSSAAATTCSCSPRSSKASCSCCRSTSRRCAAWRRSSAS